MLTSYNNRLLITVTGKRAIRSKFDNLCKTGRDSPDGGLHKRQTALTVAL
jgi:hypothetical protein